MPTSPKTPPAQTPAAGSAVSAPAPSGRSAATLKAVLLAPVTVAEQALAGAPMPVVYLAAGALAVTGVVEWPVVGLVAAGVWLAQRRPVPASPVSKR